MDLLNLSFVKLVLFKACRCVQECRLILYGVPDHYHLLQMDFIFLFLLLYSTFPPTHILLHCVRFYNQEVNGFVTVIVSSTDDVTFKKKKPKPFSAISDIQLDAACFDSELERKTLDSLL